MKIISGPRVHEATPRAAAKRVLIWDAPVRLFHWLLVLCFAGAYLTAESDAWRLVHVTFGYTMAGLLVFRILWGWIGTRHARFTDFVRGPRAVIAYLKSLWRGTPEHHAGHNPAGGLAILALLGLAALVTASGWATYQGSEWLEDVHEGLANAMLALVGIHVAAVAVSSWLHHENLIGAMIHGRKPAPAEQGIRSSRRVVSAMLLAAVLAFWWSQWRSAPSMPAGHHAVAIHESGQGIDHIGAMRECGHAHTPC
jgi:cytochrome b